MFDNPIIRSKHAAVHRKKSMRKIQYARIILKVIRSIVLLTPSGVLKIDKHYNLCLLKTIFQLVYPQSEPKC